MQVLLSSMLVEQSTEEEVQQYIYNEVDNMLYILYLEDCAVFSLNTAGAFSSIIHAIRWDSYSEYLICYSYKIIPVSDWP